MNNVPVSIGWATAIAIIIGTVAIWLMLFRALDRLDITKRQNAIAHLAYVVMILGWLISVMVEGYRGFFEAESTRFPRPILGAAVAIVIGLILFSSKLFHEILNVMPHWWLIAWQFMRTIGVIFLALLKDRLLPKQFALPLGTGDTLIGLTAPFIAYLYFKQKPWSHAVAIGWNILGLLSIAVSGAVGVLDMSSTIQRIHTVPNVDIVTVFPLVIYPVYAMPLVVLIHLFSLYYLFRRTGRTSRAAPAG
jgi:hypothetical protein